MIHISPRPPFFLLSLLCVFTNQAAHEVLIIGCGRSGTEYMAELLASVGLKVLHEKLGQEGTVSWPMTYGALNLAPSNQQSRLSFKHIFHQVRNPLHVISSWYTRYKNLDSIEWQFIRNHIPEMQRHDSLLIHCAKYYYYWNLTAEQQAEWTYRIEDVDQNLEAFFVGCETRLDRKLNRLRRHTASYRRNATRQPKEKITWEMLAAGLPQELFEQLQAITVHYEYSLENLPEPVSYFPYGNRGISVPCAKRRALESIWKLSRH